jgi:PKD repeat protein
MCRYQLLLIVIFVGHIYGVFATEPPRKYFKTEQWLFEKSQGQLVGRPGSDIDRISYFSQNNGNFAVYCLPTGIRFNFYQVDKTSGISEASGKQQQYDHDAPVRLKQAIVEMHLDGANENATVSASDKQDFYKNYYQSYLPHPVLNVNTYKSIIYENVYPHIDMRLHVLQQGMKYEFVVHPGGNPKEIRILWSGLKDLQCDVKGGITYTHSLGKIKESAPVTYSADGQKVKSSFKKSGDVINFNIAAYNHKEDLVIDPSVLWGWYTGVERENQEDIYGFDERYNLVFNQNKDVIVVGSTLNGAPDNSPYNCCMQWCDAVAIKYDSTGAVKWWSSFGGFWEDYFYAVDVDKNNNVFVGGKTQSDTGMTTPGVFMRNKYDSGFHSIAYAKFLNAQNYETPLQFGAKFTNAGWICKLDPNGKLKWASFTQDSVNKQGDETVNFIKADNNGSVYFSAQAGLCTSGAYQTKPSGSGFYIGKISDDGKTLQWGSYYGGNTGSTLHGMTVDNASALYLAGVTTSTDLATSGADQTSLKGSSDGFLAKFSSSGKHMWCTYLGGSSSDQLSDVISDKGKYLYVSGNAASDGLAKGSSIHQNTRAGNNDVILAQYDTAGARNWTTYYGGASDESVFRMGMDGFNNILFTGYSSSTSGIALAPTYFSHRTGYYFASFNTSGKQNMGSYYISLGDPIILRGFAVAQSHKMVVLGYNKYRSDSIHYTGTGFVKADMDIANQNNDGHDNFIMMFDPITSNGCTVPKARFGLNKRIECRGYNISPADSSANASSYLWDFGDNTTSSSTSPSHAYSKGGFYTIRLVVSNSCGSDSTFRNIYIDSACVWPGDANYDKKVSVKDILSIGVAYGDTGYKRPSASITWDAQGCHDWAGYFSSGVNYKHADCNGDGLVDSNDLSAIITNYSKTHPKTFATGGDTTNPALFLSISKDSVSVKDTLSIGIQLGTSAKQLKSVYGLAFSISYDPSAVDTSKSVQYDFSKCWLGTPGKDLIYIVKNNKKSGSLDIGLCRTDHKNVSGYGKLGQVGIIMPDNVAGKDSASRKLRLEIGDIKLINFNEDDIPLYTYSDSVTLYQNSGVSENITSAFDMQVYPNPTTASVQINTGQSLIKNIELMNMLGQRIASVKTADATNYNLSLSNYAPGMYILNVYTSKGTGRCRVMKQ